MCPAAVVNGHTGARPSLSAVIANGLARRIEATRSRWHSIRDTPWSSPAPPGVWGGSRNTVNRFRTVAPRAPTGHTVPRTWRRQSRLALLSERLLCGRPEVGGVGAGLDDGGYVGRVDVMPLSDASTWPCPRGILRGQGHGRFLQQLCAIALPSAGLRGKIGLKFCGAVQRTEMGYEKAFPDGPMAYSDAERGKRCRDLAFNHDGPVRRSPETTNHN